MEHRSRTSSDVQPSLFYEDAPAAIAWLARAFGFVERLVVVGPVGTVRHSELSLGSVVIFVSSADAGAGRASPRSLPSLHQMICVWVEDPDGHYARAKAAGATIVQELRDEDYGARGYLAEDPEGHRWYFSDYRPGAHWGAG